MRRYITILTKSAMLTSIPICLLHASDFAYGEEAGRVPSNSPTCVSQAKSKCYNRVKKERALAQCDRSIVSTWAPQSATKSIETTAALNLHLDRKSVTELEDQEGSSRYSKGTANPTFASAARADCREAYRGFGLLALPFLIKDTVTGVGCKW